MITRREIRGLAEFQSARGCAVTFYYQPGAPPNQSHREEAILVKDLVRGALREAEKEGRNDYARADLNRMPTRQRTSGASSTFRHGWTKRG